MLVIYKAEFPNGKVYIGKTKNFEQRKYHHIWNSHREENSHIIMYKAICKYGSDNINWSILCECLDNDDMNKKEIEDIKMYNSTLHKFGYNMVCGDKEGYKKRENFNDDYQLDIIFKKLKSNGHDPNKYVVMTDDLLEKIKNDYIKNKISIRELVRKYKITKHRMTRILKSENIEIDQNRCKLTNSKKFDDDFINKVISMYSNGLLIKQIANKENKTIMIISRILHDSGVRISKRFSDGRMSDGSKPRKKKSIDE
jgi:hypothetical protein